MNQDSSPADDGPAPEHPAPETVSAPADAPSSLPLEEVPSGLPPDEPEETPLGVDDDAPETAVGPGAMPGIPTEGEPPSGG